MIRQQLSRASPSEGFSIARQVMDDVAERFLNDGGPAVARAEVNKVAEVLMKVYDDGKEAYDAVMERIRQFEAAEQEANERKLQQMMMSAVLNAIPKDGQGRQLPHNGVGQAGAASGDVVLPPKLSSPKAMLMWQRMQQAGMIDDRYQPVGLTRTEMALLAEEMNIRLGDENDKLLGIMEWKPYETLWHKNHMKSDLQRANIQDKTPEFRDRLKQLFAGI